MKKVAILTQPLHTNYGGTLQAYALQQVVTSLGSEVVTIDYQWKQRSITRYILAVIKSHLLNRKEKFPFFMKEKEIRETNHSSFIKKYIKRSEIILSEEELINNFKNNQYDTVIVGSDQVWRKAYSPNIDNFFLNFVDDSTLKIAYAASFGIDTWQFNDEKTFEIKKLLKKFKAISVREDSAVKLCSEKLNLDVEHVLDPTLLLSLNDYINLTEDIEKKQKGIFTYILDNSKDKELLLGRLKKELKLNTFSMQPKKIYKTDFFIKNPEDYIYPKIEDWLASFRDSKFIVTDSFHGTVFAIIFNKPFISIANNERGSTRFLSLLKIFNLENRLVTSLDDVTEELIYKNIDFEKVNSLLKIERERSLLFLRLALSNNE
ncbi:polysaccharide pyruvyl transferase family protein [Acinetobacter sp. CAAS 2-6]|uniref:polysaccharide pyruvyl transferase family protein n=1 Tax=Acinetobacter sp. CAAS 2-6 TaxID=3016358 RepID=UPI002DD65774|nr:polysaccharide pyruvyl transferase family protein [Acinetobacter sp. CAAS 2-6]